MGPKHLEPSQLKAFIRKLRKQASQSSEKKAAPVRVSHPDSTLSTEDKTEDKVHTKPADISPKKVLKASLRLAHLLARAGAEKVVAAQDAVAKTKSTYKVLKAAKADLSAMVEQGIQRREAKALDHLQEKYAPRVIKAEAKFMAAKKMPWLTQKAIRKYAHYKEAEATQEFDSAKAKAKYKIAKSLEPKALRELRKIAKWQAMQMSTKKALKMKAKNRVVKAIAGDANHADYVAKRDVAKRDAKVLKAEHKAKDYAAKKLYPVLKKALKGLPAVLYNKAAPLAPVTSLSELPEDDTESALRAASAAVDQKVAGVKRKLSLLQAKLPGHQ